MSDLRWDEVAEFFDPDLMGTLPDVVVPGASVQDWQAVFDVVTSSRWTWEYRVGQEAAPLPSAAEALTYAAAEYRELWVYPAADVLVIFRLYAADQIDFDMDLRELQGQQGVDCVCDFLSVLGRRLGKFVLMCAEGDYKNPVLGFDPAVDHVVLLADPRLRAGERLPSGGDEALPGVDGRAQLDQAGRSGSDYA